MLYVYTTHGLGLCLMVLGKIDRSSIESCETAWGSIRTRHAKAGIKQKRCVMLLLVQQPLCFLDAFCVRAAMT